MSDRLLNLVGISGSLRRNAHSNSLLNSCAEMLPAQAQLSMLNIDMPFYNADLETHSVPTDILAARHQVAISDGIIIATSEYNHSLPGVLKNALDWLSRPVRASCMQGKPVFFLTQSQGALGGARAQHALREVLSSMLCILPPMAEIAVTFADQKIRDGRLIDPVTIEFVQAQLDSFITTVTSST